MTDDEINDLVLDNYINVNNEYLKKQIEYCEKQIKILKQNEPGVRQKHCGGNMEELVTCPECGALLLKRPKGYRCPSCGLRINILRG